ncbi:hypothetical protein V1514DRAFT_338726 [Lipomyces japonicus]|uniref:uncharacterized protein n=1 Tax=Lipomyces japonicus TaxID=56871 RepID=UPI0034CDC2DD
MEANDSSKSQNEPQAQVSHESTVSSVSSNDKLAHPESASVTESVVTVNKSTLDSSNIAVDNLNATASVSSRPSTTGTTPDPIDQYNQDLDNEALTDRSEQLDQKIETGLSSTTSPAIEDQAGDANSSTTQSNADAPKAATAKKSFKSQSLNSIFRKLQATLTPKTQAETVSTTTHQVTSSSLAAAKLRMTPKLSTQSGSYSLAPLRRDLSISPRPGSTGLRSSNGSGTKQSGSAWKSLQAEPSKPSQATTTNTNSTTGSISSPSTTATKNIVVTQPSKRHMSEDELRKLGIHLTESIAVHKDSEWDDDDDDDDANWAETLEFGDGTKVLLSQSEPKSDEPKTDSKAPDSISTALPQSLTKSSPWATVPRVQPTSLQSVLSGEDNRESRGRDQIRPGHHDAQHSFFREDEQLRSHSITENSRYGPQDVRNQAPIVVPRDRGSEDFDRSYGSRPNGRGELFNDRSGLMEPARRKSFTSRRPLPQIGSSGFPSRSDRPPSIERGAGRRGSSSIASADRRRLSTTSRPSVDDDFHRRPGSPVLSSEGGALALHDEKESPVLSHAHLPGTHAEEPVRPAYITAQQQGVMKKSLEAARKRKELEQKKEQERLEAAKRRADELGKKKLLQKAEPVGDEQTTASSPETEHASVENKPSSTTSSVTNDVRGRFERQRKESIASSDGAEGIDASVTAAIEFLISDPSASHSPPISRANISKHAQPGSSWDQRHPNNRSLPAWGRNSLHENSRPSHFRNLVNGGDNVWGPIGSKSRYPAIDGAGNGTVEPRPFISESNDSTTPSSNWQSHSLARHSHDRLSENWRRPIASPTTGADQSNATSTSTTTKKSLQAPVGTPLSSPDKSRKLSIDGPSSPIQRPQYNEETLSSTIPPSKATAAATSPGVAGGSSSSSRPFSRFFPSTSTNTAASFGPVSGSAAIENSFINNEGYNGFLNRYADQDPGEYVYLSQSAHSLSDDSGNLTPKVHLPNITVNLPRSSHHHDLRSDYNSKQNLETAGKIQYSPRQFGTTTFADAASMNMPSIGAIEAVQSRIAMTLGSHADTGSIFGGKPNADKVSLSTKEQAVRKPITILQSLKHSPVTVEPYENFGLPEHSSYPVKLAKYPDSFVVFENIVVSQRTCRPVINFAYYIHPSVSSADPASNPFLPSRRDSVITLSGYRILLPGQEQHILIPVKKTSSSGATELRKFHGTYRGRSHRGDYGSRKSSRKQ